ncbi:hypothetical protein GCM10027568_08490 [Humibacter soli]
MSVDNPSPLLKQFPTTLMVAVATLIAITVPHLRFSNVVLGVVSVALVAVATLLAWVLGRSARGASMAVVVPLIDFVALGIFRAATGGSTSIFAAIIILPVVWVAAERGRGYILVAAAGASVALFMPYLLGAPVPASGVEAIRAVFAPAVYAFAAAIINELARQSRVQVTRLADMAAERQRMLEEETARAAELEASRAAYREADRMFRGVWAAVTEQAVIGTNVDGLIDAWNPGAARMLGRSAQETEGSLPVTEFYLGEELDSRADELDIDMAVRARGWRALVFAASDGVAERSDWTYVRADGTSFPAEVTVTPRLNESGSVIGYLFVASDTTRAAEAARLKDEFVGLISHELRTPLSSILGYLELLRDDEENPLGDEQLHYLEVAERNAHRLLRLVGDLLFTAQVESGRFPLEMGEVRLRDVVDAAVESARPAAAAVGVTLDARLDDVGEMRGDATRLGQVCDNLISNALKFTPRGGRVTVRLFGGPDDVVIEVEDSGIGIPAAELDRLFSRFFRASSATRNAIPGVGLGLTISKAIVTAHGGRLGVESREGEGTCFRATLPLNAPVVGQPG